jgi:hypothetical protein
LRQRMSADKRMQCSMTGTASEAVSEDGQDEARRYSASK